MIKNICRRFTGIYIIILKNNTGKEELCNLIFLLENSMKINKI